MGRPPLSAQTRRAYAEEDGILVSEEDDWLLEAFTWRIDADGYAVTTIRIGERWVGMKMHHCILGQPIYEGDEIDHRNRIPNDNRRHNLRYATRSEQALNRMERIRDELGRYRGNE
jgi:hypothetical protein